uniref:Uncharacterized protein n=1 Tax=Oncorhynchus tshawytscha TaxID=74940 RepID=A0AAZ3QW30_ONCTS
MHFKVRAAAKEDCKEISRMIMELAVYENMADQVKTSHEDLKRDGFSPNPFYECLIAEVPDEHKTKDARVHFGLPHIHGGSRDGGATHQRSQVMAHPQCRESSPEIRQLFPEVHPGLQHGGRTSYLPAERTPVALLDGGGGEDVRDVEDQLLHCSRAGTS